MLNPYIRKERDKITMTIDQRLEALLHRHEALAQSVELMAGMQKQTEKEIRSLARLVRVIVVDHEQRLLKLEGLKLEGEEEN